MTVDRDDGEVPLPENSAVPCITEPRRTQQSESSSQALMLGSWTYQSLRLRGQDQNSEEVPATSAEIRLYALGGPPEKLGMTLLFRPQELNELDE